MRRTVTLSGAAFAALFIVLILLVVPAGAQEDGGIPPGTPANGVDTGDTSDPPDVVLVAANGCTVSPGASITIEDGDGTQATLTDGARGITITDQNGRPRIESEAGDFVGDHATFPGRDDDFDTDGDYSVVSSTGITGCSGGGASPAQDQYQNDGAVDDPKGVVPDTVKVKKVPSTGGPPFIALGALVLLSVSVVIGGRILRP